MKKVFLLTLIVVFALSAIAQTRPAPKEDAAVAVQTTRTAAAEVQRVAADSRFKAALQIIEENGERLELSSARTVSARQTVAAAPREIVFNIAGSGGQPPEFQRLVVLEQPGKPPLVYFDGPTVTTEPPPKGPATTTTAGSNARLCIFTPWGSWQVLRTYCAYRYWCFLKGQKAIYCDERRERQCTNGVHVQTRTVLVHCGC